MASELKATLLGKTGEDFTSLGPPRPNGQPDIHIRVEGLKRGLKQIRVHGHYKDAHPQWVSPCRDVSKWSIAIKNWNKDKSTASLFICPPPQWNFNDYGALANESEPPFEVIARYSTKNEETKTEDGRKGFLTPEEEFKFLKSMLDNEWPQAVHPFLICDTNSEEDKKERAAGIVDLLTENVGDLSELKILDYGCGEGHVATHLNAIGYDAQKHWLDSGKLTTDFSEIKKNSPFDLILLYDVLDHVEKEAPIEVLAKIKLLCHKDTKVFLRCHPWSSRHGGHLYQHINKAFIHLIFTNEELKRLGYKPDYSRKVISPSTYENWFSSMGFEVEKKDVIENRYEMFLKNKIISERIKSCQIEHPEISFVDYIITYRD
jgi:2-polyprenyl-3-methyl-5-hydroxy-6-metoxy-1,4-benzoquinol methylase